MTLWTANIILPANNLAVSRLLSSFKSNIFYGSIWSTCFQDDYVRSECIVPSLVTSDHVIKTCILSNQLGQIPGSSSKASGLLHLCILSAIIILACVTRNAHMKRWMRSFELVCNWTSHRLNVGIEFVSWLSVSWSPYTVAGSQPYTWYIIHMIQLYTSYMYTTVFTLIHIYISTHILCILHILCIHIYIIHSEYISTWT